MTMENSNHNVTVSFQAGASMQEFMAAFQGGSGGGIPGLAGGEGQSQIVKAMSQMQSEIKRRVPPLDAFFKSIGIEVSLKSILKQSQIFTSSVGSIFQIMGALVDVMLAPFIKYIVKGIEVFASWIPKIGQAMDWIERNIFAHIATVITKFKDFLTDPLGFIFGTDDGGKPKVPEFIPFIGGKELPDVGIPDSIAEVGMAVGAGAGLYAGKRKFFPKGPKKFKDMNADEITEALGKALAKLRTESDAAAKVVDTLTDANTNFHPRATNVTNAIMGMDDASVPATKAMNDTAAAADEVARTGENLAGETGILGKVRKAFGDIPDNVNNLLTGEDGLPKIVKAFGKVPGNINDLLTGADGLPKIVKAFGGLFTGGRGGLLAVVVAGIAGIIVAVQKLFGKEPVLKVLPDVARVTRAVNPWKVKDIYDESAEMAGEIVQGTRVRTPSDLADLENLRNEADELAPSRRIADNLRVRTGLVQEAQELGGGGWGKSIIKSQRDNVDFYTKSLTLQKLKDADFLTSLNQLKKVFVSDEAATALSRTTRGMRAALPIIGTAGAAWMGYEGFTGHQDYLTSQERGGLLPWEESTSAKEALQTYSVMGMDIGGTALGMITSFMGPGGWLGAAGQEGIMMGANQLTGQGILDYTIPGAIMDLSEAVSNMWSPTGINGHTVQGEGWDYYRDPNVLGTGYGVRKLEGVQAQAVEITVNVNTGEATYRNLSADVAGDFWEATNIADAEGNTSSVQVEAKSRQNF